MTLTDHGADLEKYCEVMHAEKRDKHCDVCRQKVALGKLQRKNPPAIRSAGEYGYSTPKSRDALQSSRYEAATGKKVEPYRGCCARLR